MQIGSILPSASISFAAPAAQQLVPTLERANAFLGDAQQIAVDVIEMVAPATPKQLYAGAQLAETAAGMLRLIPPASEFQDLPAAAAFVTDGANKLRQAAQMLEFNPNDQAQVRQLAIGAYDAFDAAFEITTND